MYRNYFRPNRLSTALEFLSNVAGKVSIIAGGTDLMIEMKDKAHDDISIIDITGLDDLNSIRIDRDGYITIGGNVTHNQIVDSAIIRDHAYPLLQACWSVGSPQIRNRGTVAGNLVTASPSNDTIPVLIALDAELKLQSSSHIRKLKLIDFYTGVRKTCIQRDEILVQITFKTINKESFGNFLKFGLREAQAIAVVNSAAILEQKNNLITRARITLGAVAPTVIKAIKAEEALIGQELTNNVIETTSNIAAEEAMPIDDIRGSASLRRKLVYSLVKDNLIAIRDSIHNKQVPSQPVLLVRQNSLEKGELPNSPHDSILQLTINDHQYSIAEFYNKTLLQIIRDDLRLTGTKEGCNEGECGACTVLMDGKAVMSCLVPAPSTNLSEIYTIEYLSSNGKLHPLQKAFIEEGAVQCGYCTPGFIMSGYALLEEKTDLSEGDIKHALSGNLCRCTGYYKIIKAVESAALN